MSQRVRLISAVFAVGVLTAGQSACGRSTPEESKTTAPPAAAAPATQASAPASPEAGATPPAAADELPSDSAIAKMLTPAKGDLDEMIERR